MSSSLTLYYWRVFCITESTNVYSWDTTEPTVCPRCADHAIDTSSITIVNKVNKNIVEISEQDEATGGHYACGSIVINATRGKKTTVSVSWPFPTSILAVQFVSEEIHRGDEMSLSVGGATPIGFITKDTVLSTPWAPQNYTVGQTVIFKGRIYTCINNTVNADLPIASLAPLRENALYWRSGFELCVSATVIQYVEVGFFIAITDAQTNPTNPTTNNLGRVLGVDKVHQKIFVEAPPTTAYSSVLAPPRMPAAILLSVIPIPYYKLAGPMEHILGQSKIGSMALPPNVNISVTYNNLSSDTDKVLVGNVEYLY